MAIPEGNKSRLDSPTNDKNTSEWRCSGPGTQLGGICLNRLPCADHGVTTPALAVALYGCVYEQREGEIALHLATDHYVTQQDLQGE
jgi:hypothetical protein